MRKMKESFQKIEKRLRMATGVMNDREILCFAMSYSLYKYSIENSNADFQHWVGLALDLLETKEGLDSPQLNEKITLGILWAKNDGFSSKYDHKIGAKMLMRHLDAVAIGNERGNS